MSTLDSGSESREYQVIPITTPSRAELWQRNQLARSLLSHRPCSTETTRLVLAVLDGTAEAR
ncbi:hypothetical protein FHU38_000957 [Saccharomonospora amisosensis]|uniref:Uncharacterized protein n=1 Tax=Saccharomonospora amisosensis TaxID=1128677 RepID=A0A7X5ZPB1_9PSEU|nr:hypothetical protein [Saccharomonospora amisosensis]NIJ10613.1 hypothetical protein [Saccharomonospora amisosensis]